MDTEVEYAGYTRELYPICYGWPASTSTGASNEGIAADKLITLSTYVNGFTGKLHHLDNFCFSFRDSLKYIELKQFPSVQS